MATESTAVKIQATIERLSKRLKAGPFQALSSEEQAKMREDVLQLKKNSRLIHEEAHLAKENVATLRKATDAAHLALQSVHYEKKHLEKELSQILATDAYDSIEFSVPEAPSTADPMVAMNNKLIRVKNEVALRQNMAKKAAEMEADLAAMKSEVTSLSDLLGAIPSKVGEVEKALQSLEKFVGIPSLSGRREMHETMANAPHALVSLFEAFEIVHDDPKYMSLFNLTVKDEQPSITVVLEFPAQSETVEFTYSPEWNIALVESLVVQDLLINLLDESDSGESLPHNVQNKADPPNFKNTLKRPYRWAQALAKLPLSEPFAQPITGLMVIDKLLDRANIKKM